MTLSSQWQKHALALVGRAGPVDRDYFRCVELSNAFPDDVISGEGSRLYGGRFVRPGIRAVYGSADEDIAMREAAARRQRLAGAAGIQIADLPRITYVIAVKLAIGVDLTASDADVEAILPACLDSDFADSQDFGEFWLAHGIQAIVYPSAVPGLVGSNIVVFRDAAPQPAVVLVNRDRIIEELRRLSARLQL